MLRWRNALGPVESARGERELKLAFGGEARHEQGRAASPFGLQRGERNQIAGFADLDLWRGRWSGAAGLRFDHYQGLAARGTYYLGTGYQLRSFHERFFPLIGIRCCGRKPPTTPRSALTGSPGRACRWPPPPMNSAMPT